MQCTLVKSEEIENSHPLLYNNYYILLKSWLCCCLLTTLAPQQKLLLLLLISSSSSFYKLLNHFTYDRQCLSRDTSSKEPTSWKSQCRKQPWISVLVFQSQFLHSTGHQGNWIEVQGFHIPQYTSYAILFLPFLAIRSARFQPLEGHLGLIVFYATGFYNSKLNFKLGHY